MTKLYKLTTSDHKTRKGYPEETQWGEGVTHTASGEGELCAPGWLHAYTHPLLAVLLNRIHADIEDPTLWECEGYIGKEDNGLKVGCKTLTTLSVLPTPHISTEQRVRFAILCAKQVCSEQSFITWADGWLEGKDRTESSARATAAAAWAATRAADAAEAAASSAEAAASSAEVAAAAAAWAARADAAANSAVKKGKNIDLVALAEEAVKA